MLPRSRILAGLMRDQIRCACLPSECGEGTIWAIIDIREIDSPVDYKPVIYLSALLFTKNDILLYRVPRLCGRCSGCVNRFLILRKYRIKVTRLLLMRANRVDEWHGNSFHPPVDIFSEQHIRDADARIVRAWNYCTSFLERRNCKEWPRFSLNCPLALPVRQETLKPWSERG